ncbi:hypothetical protein SVIO_092800 [Streptomyces violaceusniger]|uniref:Uncharacterized protein n=1 Tax=Streptomyces violaceusniger TaxID=68280 RepID=A0A4D4LJS9_STRVO|nr:hypothetical protein SVIO_092800 [Streptomyces violaceusniger]
MYLVGKRWSVTGLSMGSLEPLREKIGGSLEKGMSMSHGGSPGGTKSGAAWTAWRAWRAWTVRRAMRATTGRSDPRGDGKK